MSSATKYVVAERAEEERFASLNFLDESSLWLQGGIHLQLKFYC